MTVQTGVTLKNIGYVFDMKKTGQIKFKLSHSNRYKNFNMGHIAVKNLNLAAIAFSVNVAIT